MTTNTQQHEAFGDLLLALCRHGLKKPPTPKAAGMIASGYVVSNELEVHRLVKKSLRGSLGSRVIALGSPNEGKFSSWLLALWAEWDFEREDAKAKIEVSFIEDRRKAFYFRFESAHSDRSRHDYRHAQFSRNFSPPIAGPTSHWEVNDSMPAFPLACGDEAGLLVACAISIYGTKMDPDIRTTIQRMNLRDGYLRSMLGPAV